MYVHNNHILYIYHTIEYIIMDYHMVYEYEVSVRMKSTDEKDNLILLSISPRRGHYFVLFLQRCIVLYIYIHFILYRSNCQLCKTSPYYYNYYQSLYVYTSLYLKRHAINGRYVMVSAILT